MSTTLAVPTSSVGYKSVNLGGNHMMTYTVAGNSNASAQSCQSVKRSCPDVSTYALFKRQLMELICIGDAVRLFHSGNNIRLLYGTEW
ncbi:hypothetical protein Tco_1534761 [Tanacetum coccineum]